jgi:hypothetical protein
MFPACLSRHANRFGSGSSNLVVNEGGNSRDLRSRRQQALAGRHARGSCGGRRRSCASDPFSSPPVSPRSDSSRCSSPPDPAAKFKTTRRGCDRRPDPVRPRSRFLFCRRFTTFSDGRAAKRHIRFLSHQVRPNSTKPQEQLRDLGYVSRRGATLLVKCQRADGFIASNANGMSW